MLGFVQNLFTSAHPIGVDFGTDTLRLAQVQTHGDDFKLIAAASAEIPVTVRDGSDDRLEFFTESVRNLLHHGKFRGRRAILGLPSFLVHTQHLTVEHVDEKQLKDLIQQQARRKLPFDPDFALFRHAVAGQTPDPDDPRLQVVVMAADTRWVNQYLAAAKKARLDVVGMNMQHLALIDCFSSVYRRTIDQKSVSMYVDIGSSGTRITIAQGTRLLFARNLPIGGQQLTAAVSESLGISRQNAKTLRLKLIAGADQHAERIEASCSPVIEKLAKELDLCRGEHESLFPNLKIDRLIFVGGEARLETLCNQIANRLKLPGQMGDTLCRMARNSCIGVESAIDRRHPQPAWAAAIGLSMGPPDPDKIYVNPEAA